MQDWQHAAMYGAFLASGLVDLLGHWCPKGTLPPGLEHVRPQHHSSAKRQCQSRLHASKLCPSLSAAHVASAPPPGV